MQRPRVSATVVMAGACWVCGLATVWSFDVWKAWYPLSVVPAFANATIFILLDHLTSNIMLPFRGFALALFAGWVLPGTLLAEEIGLTPGTVHLLQVLLCTIVPTSIAVATLFPLFSAKL
jgi:NSS family neurotransmitter:Na+ symporter